MMATIFGVQAMGIDVMLPALEIIGDHYAIEKANHQQWIIFAFILGFGFPQLFFGPIADRFGRKVLLQICLLIYFVSSFACVIAPNFESFLGLRLVQGICCAGTRVAAGAIIRDLSKGRSMASILSLVYTVFMIIPILSPALGTAIMAVVDWRWIFIVLGLFSIVIFVWTQIRLPMTLDEDNRRSFSMAQTFAGFKKVASHRTTAGYMIASGIIYGCLFSFIAASEQVFDEVFHRSDKFYLYFAGIAGLLAIMTYSNSRVVGRFGMRRISHAVVLIYILLSGLNLLYMHFIGQDFWVFYILFALSFGCFGMMGANFSSLALEFMGDIAGTASAVYGFVTMTLSFLLGVMVAQGFDGTVRPLLFAYVVLGVSSFIVILITERGKLFRIGEGKT